jgi:hypothetical protein
VNGEDYRNSGRLAGLEEESWHPPANAVSILGGGGQDGRALMFANLLHLITGRSDPDSGRDAFVQEVRVQERERRNPKVERFIFICWALIAIKHVAVIWAVARYPVPFHQLWINFPTWLLGVLATAIYYGRSRRR